MNIKSLFILILCVLSLSACNTMEGLGKDIKRGGEAIEGAASKNKAAP